MPALPTQSMILEPTVGTRLSADWRTDAMIRAVEIFSADPSRSAHYLLAWIQRRDLNFSIRLCCQDRVRALRTLPECLQNLRPVVRSPRLHAMEEKENASFPFYGWWEGYDPLSDSAFEIILTPSRSGCATFLIVGPCDKAVARLMYEWEAKIKALDGRFRSFTGTWSDDPEMEAEAMKIGWDDLVLMPATLADIRGCIDQFFTQKEVFASLKFPWRRGILLVGPPGTGKTMVCKAAAASHPNVPFLYVSDISRPGHLKSVFEYARECSPCILAFEDIDGLPYEGLRASFLNELDGFRNNDGLLLIASSNHPERIDEALLKRPSRFDRVYHIGLPGFAERREYARRLLRRAPNLSPDLDTEVLAADIARSTEGFTPAFLKEVFLSVTLQMAQEGRDRLDDTFVSAVRSQTELLYQYLKKANTINELHEQIGASNGIGFRPRRANRYDDDND